jgi:hypothetical protein
MPYLMQIGIDKAFHLAKNVHYFQFNGIGFKFIQNPPTKAKRWSDALITIVDDLNSAQAQTALTTAGQWASALAWETRRPMAVHLMGGGSWRKGLPLRRARCNIFTWPRLPFLGDMRGFSFWRIARTTTDDQRTALTIFREAQASNSVLLTILLYWQVLEVGPGKPVNWINRAIARAKGLHTARRHIGELNLGGRRLGDYLLDDCRHAIAHLKRKPGRTALRFDNLDETRRLGASAVILEDLAKEYIESTLGLSGHLSLVRPRRGGFPVYVDSSKVQMWLYKSVDPPWA